MKPGRKGTADNVVSLVTNETRPKLTPCRPLTKAERSIFNLVCQEHIHLTPLDTPLLTTFAVAVAATYTKMKVSDFEKLTRVALSIGTKLRITPQARTNPLTLARAHRRAERSYYERTRDDDPE